jgi:hypothetical protein
LVSKIQDYEFDIEFVKGKINVVADAFSKRPSVYAMLDISVHWKAHLLVQYSKNRFTCELMDGKVQDDKFRIMDEIIYDKGRISLVLVRIQNESIAGMPRFTIGWASRIFQNIQAGKGKIHMEGNKRGCNVSYQGMFHFSGEQRGAHSSSKFIATTPYSRE